MRTAHRLAAANAVPVSFSVMLAAVLATVACAPPSTDDVDGANQKSAFVDLPSKPAPPPVRANRFGPPRTDLVPALGDDDHLDVAAWNVRNFPAVETTAASVANLVASMNLDVVGFEEIASTEAFDELVERLPDFDSVLSTDAYNDGTYQKIALLYRRDVATVVDQRLLYIGPTWDFPRPPLQVTLLVDDGKHEPRTVVVIGVHLKAGRADEDYERRAGAIASLDTYVKSLVDGGNELVLVQGDFNEDARKTEGLANFQPFLDDKSYTLETLPLSRAREATFLPSRGVIDHMVTSKALGDAIPDDAALIPELQDLVDDYQREVSDHLPVVMPIPL